MTVDARLAALEAQIRTLTVKLAETSTELAGMTARTVQLEHAFGTVFCTFASPELTTELLTHLDLVKLDLLELGLPRTPNDLRALIAEGLGTDGPGVQRKV